MKTIRHSLLLLLPFIALCFTSCRRSSDEVWDDTKTAGRHVSRGIKRLGGKHGDSRQVCSREEFLRYKEDYCVDDIDAMQFEPLPDQKYSDDVGMASRTKNETLPSQEPGHPSGRIPGIDSFQDPRNNPALAQVFQNIHFAYNSNLIKGTDNTDKLRAIAENMKSTPNLYIFVEGHCDERGAEAFNLALGARRSNTVRDFLVKEGVGPERIFTVSYGKEHPIDLGHNEEAWAKNRRTEFKVYYN